MNVALEFAVRTALIGVGATAGLDLWGQVTSRLFGKPNWSMVGRWIGNFARGKLIHSSMANAPAVRGELAIGWSAHYLIGIAYAALLVAMCGLDWARIPTPWPALAFGVLTVLAPFLIMQPCMGIGVAASKAPHPVHARVRSVLGHTVFGLGLYLSALATSGLSLF